jgi:hypothetical protein
MLDFDTYIMYITDMENQEEIKLFDKKFTKDDIRKIASLTFIEMAKAVIDINQKVIAIGGELHADAEAVLLDNGSRQPDLWGINLYPDKPSDHLIEYTSLINIRPSIGNRTQEISDSRVKNSIKQIVFEMLEDK